MHYYDKFFLYPTMTPLRSSNIILLTLFAFAVICWMPTHRAAAHGEDSAVQLARKPAGDYLLTVITSPASLHVGAVHFAVQITDRQHNQPLLGKQVLIEAMPLEAGDDIISSQALLAPTLLFAYETHLVLPKAGRYQVTVTVIEANRAKHAVSFEVYARSVVVFQWITLSLFAQAFVVAGWLLKEGLIVWRRPLTRFGSTMISTDN